MKNKSKLSEFIENPNRSLWRLALPMTLGLFVNSIYVLADLYFVSQMPGVGLDASSALGYVMPFYFILIGITFGLSSGSTTVIAQYIGQNNRDKANQSAHNTLLLAGVMALINLFFVVFLGKAALSLQGMSPVVLELATEYFYVMAYGSTFMIFGIFLRGILIGEGEAMVPMYALGVGTVLNIVLDPFFIDQWGIAGAAYATIVSQIIVLFIFLYFFLIRQTTYISLFFKKIDFNFPIWKKIFNIGFPGSISMLIMSIGLFIMNSIFIHDADVAAYNLAARIENFITLTLISISTSQVTIVGMFYGAERFHLIKPLVKYTTFWSIIIVSIFGFIAFFLVEDVAPLFFEMNGSFSVSGSDQLKPEDFTQAINGTVSYYKIMFIAFPFLALTMVSTRAIQAIGKAWPMTIVTIIRVFILQCGLSYIFIRELEYSNIEWAWYATAISCIGSGVIAYLFRLHFLQDKYLEQNN